MSWIPPYEVSSVREHKHQDSQAPIPDTPTRVLSSKRIFPQSKPTSPQTVPLSILDAGCASYSAPSAILFFDPPKVAAHPNHLELSLSRTLNAYPQICGQAHLSNYHYSTYKPEDGHTRRFGRVFQTFGEDSDAGVELRIVECSYPLSSFLLSTDTRRKKGHWDPSELTEFLSPTTLALSDLYGDTAGLPCLTIQVTAFSCGSLAIGLRITHVLADAHSLAYFIHDWASVSKSMVDNLPLPDLSPIFDPQLLDQQAAGDIDAITPDPKLVQKFRSLECHDYDWYAFIDGRTFGETAIPEGFDPESILPLGTIMPWKTWNTKVPIKTCILHLSASEIQAMWEEANADANSFISHHDVIMAYVWKLINRARASNMNDFEDDDGDVYIDYSISFRKRLPALTASFLGSPITMANTGMKGKDLISQPLSIIATKIRSTVSRFDTEHIRALLHAEAHEPSPQRHWKGFLGSRHLMATSWIHTRLYGVDFGMGSKLTFVDTPMPRLDGLVVIMETDPRPADAMIDGKEKDKRSWIDDGVDLRLTLESEVMERLLMNPFKGEYVCSRDGGGNGK